MVLDTSTNEKDRSIALDYFKSSAVELDKIINDIVLKSKEIER